MDFVGVLSHEITELNPELVVGLARRAHKVALWVGKREMDGERERG
jgi:hypothetical protein